MKHRFYVSMEEGRFLMDIAKDKGYNQERLGKALSTSQTFISKLVRGKGAFRPSLATKLYQLLDRDPHISFLKTYQTNPPKNRISSFSRDSVEQTWKRLYAQHEQRLRTVYTEQNEAGRGQLIGDLERLIETFRKLE